MLAAATGYKEEGKKEKEMGSQKEEPPSKHIYGPKCYCWNRYLKVRGPASSSSNTETWAFKIGKFVIKGKKNFFQVNGLLAFRPGQGIIPFQRYHLHYCTTAETL